jgi:hypothetical protein
MEYNTHALFSSLHFGCVGRQCLLDVAISDKHISLFSAINGYKSNAIFVRE